MFLQPFHHGDAGQADAALLLDLISPFIADREIGTPYAELRFVDGSADLYGLDDLGDGFMVNHISGENAWDVLVEVARRADLVIMPTGCPTLVCRAGLLAHLPEELRDETVVVSSGAHALTVVRAR